MVVNSLFALIALFAPSDSDGIIADVVYGHRHGMALTFDVFKPEGEGNGAGVLFMVSGGWVSTWTPPKQSRAFFGALLDEGYTVFAVRHRSSPVFRVPDAVDDVRLAVSKVKEISEDVEVDPERLGAFGMSAGGHLSLMLGTTGDHGDRDIAAVVAYFPPVDLRPIVGPSDSFPALDFDRKLAPSVSPILHVSEDDAPTLLVHGDRDRLVPILNSESMHKALTKVSVPVRFVRIDGAGHGFRGQDGKRATDEMLAWFREHLVE